MSDVPNYTAGFQNPMQTFASSLQSGALMRQQSAGTQVDLAAEAKAEAARLKAEADARIQAQRDSIMARLSDPNKPATYDDYMKASMFLDKDAATAMQAAATAMNDNEKQAALIDSSQLFSTLRSGNYDLAAQLMRQHGAAEVSSKNPQGAQYAETLAKMIESGPDGARAVENLIGFQLSVLPGGKDAFDSLSKLETERRTAELFPTAKAQAEADLAKTRADTAKLEAERPDTVKLDPSALNLINAAVTTAIDADKSAIQSDNLAAAFEALRPPSGWGANFLETFKKAAGGQDKFTALKQEYIKMRNTDALKNLPPGVASDKDIEVAMSAFPDETSNPDLISSFMRGSAKLQRYTAAVNKAKSEWVNQNGSLGAARSDFTADGIPVKKGTAFWDFTSSIPVPNVVGAQPAVVTGKK